jgi:hypothetical protein
MRAMISLFDISATNIKHDQFIQPGTTSGVVTMRSSRSHESSELAGGAA